jgi:tungstate transport system substrate-binding protein
MKRAVARISLLLVAVLVMGLATPACTPAQEAPKEPVTKDVILATTTSTADTGLLDVLIPIFEEDTGYKVKPIAVGTGQALSMGKEGEADVLLVHAPASEIEVVESGAAINRQLVMHNDFVVCGPASDPAGIKGLTAAEAFAAIAESKSLFLSRGDDSGTHKKELAIWDAAGVTLPGPNDGATWYQETGSGMGTTLTQASEKQAYLLTDRGTYLSMKNTLELDILSEGDKDLLNIYHVMQVNPDKFNNVNGDGGKAFVEFMVSEKVQKIISEFGVDKYGAPLFFPDAGKPEY